jgi:hypothetical protein
VPRGKRIRELQLDQKGGKYGYSMGERSEHEKSLFRVMVIGTAISFGILGAIVGSMRGFFHGDASFAFSLRTLGGFIIGSVAGWLFWKIIQSRREKLEGD